MTGSLGTYRSQKSLKSRPWQLATAQRHFVNDYHYSSVRFPNLMNNVYRSLSVCYLRKCRLSNTVKFTISLITHTAFPETEFDLPVTSGRTWRNQLQKNKFAASEEYIVGLTQMLWLIQVVQWWSHFEFVPGPWFVPRQEVTQLWGKAKLVFPVWLILVFLIPSKD